MTTFIGHICQNAVTRYVESLKTTVTDFSVAENYSGRNGNRYTQYYKISIWDKRGANMEKYLYAGRPIQVSGRVKAGKPYQDKKGTWVAGLEIANPQIVFITANEGGEEAPEAPAAAVELPESEQPFA